MPKFSNKNVPDEFYKSSTFFTLSGSAGAVWLFCLVLANLYQDSEVLTPKIFRFIAFGLSVLIAFVMLFRVNAKKKIENYMMAFFNGLLIFVNASGLNAITSKSPWNENISKVEKRDDSKKEIQESSFLVNSFAPFKNNVSWWENDKIYRENVQLRIENEILEKSKKSLLLEKETLISENDSLVRLLRHSTEILGRSSSVIWNMKEFVDDISPELRSEEEARFFIRFRFLEEKIRGDYEYLSKTVSELPEIKDDKNYIVIVESHTSMEDLFATKKRLVSIYGEEQVAIYKDAKNIYALAVKGNGSFTRAYRLNVELKNKHGMTDAYFRGLRNWGKDYSKNSGL